MNTLTWAESGVANINRGHVSEHAPAGQRVGSIARNRTAGSTFSIAGTGNTGGGRFAVDSASGVVTVLAGAAFNFATEPSIAVDFVETLSGTSNTTTLVVNVKPNFGTSAHAVAWDTMDRLATNEPPTANITATRITGVAGFNSAQNIRPDYGYAASSSTAKVYLEYTIGAFGTGSNGPFLGLCSISHSTASTQVPGKDDSFGIAMRSDSICYVNGGLFNGGSGLPGMALAVGDVMMIAFDTGTGKIWLGKNGVWTLSGDPASGTNPLATLALDDFYAWVGPSNADTITANWGDSAFAYAAPAGFTSYKSGNPAAATGISGSASGSLALSGSATGAVKAKGSAAGTLALAVTASGTAKITGAASGSLALSGTASAVARLSGTAAATLALSGTAAGKVAVRGAASGSLSLGGAAQGTVAAPGDHGRANGTLVLVGSAAGRVRVAGQGMGLLLLSGSGTALTIALPPLTLPAIPSRTAHLAGGSRTASINGRSRSVAA